MKHLTFCIVCFMTLYISAQASGNNAVLTLEKLQKRADIAYQKKRYARALQAYQLLSEAGDKFSAFRIATMYEDGLGVDKDLVEAYAWSYLAAEIQRQTFVEYHSQIKQRLADGQLAIARARAGELIREHGIYTTAIRTKDTLRKMLFECAGSRVGNTCDKVNVDWKGCSISADRLPSIQCLRLGVIGLTSYNTMPSTVRAAQRGLDELIDTYNPGRVELGDFELIDDDVQPKEGEEN